MFGKNQPIALQLLGSSRSREALEGVAMELEDSLYPLLREVRGGTRAAHNSQCGGEVAADALRQRVLLETQDPSPFHSLPSTHNCAAR